MALFCAWRDTRNQATHTEKRLIEAVPLLNSEHYRTRIGDIEFAAFALPNTIHDVQDQVHLSESLAIAMHGHCWEPQNGGAKPLRALDLLEDGEEPLGAHSIIKITPDNIRAESDPSGIFHCYYFERDGLTVVSNSLHLIAAATGAEVDTNTGAWVAAVGYILGTGTPYKGVRAVPLGYRLQWTKESGVRLHARPDAPIFSILSPGKGFDQKRFTSDMPQAVAEASSALAIANKGEIRFPITGGKDSRLVLALCLAAGMRDRMTLFTNGMPDHPDVIVGQMIAKAVGLPHEVRPPSKTREMPTWPAEKIIADIGAMTSLSAGTLGGWDLSVPNKHQRQSMVTGHVGEVLKAYAKRKVEKTDDPFDIVRFQSPCDPIGFLKPESARNMREELLAQLAPFQGAVDLSEIPDVFYYLNRIPNWLGNLCQLKAFHREIILPLASPSLLRMALSMKASQRKAELLHYFLIKELAPSLLNIPFAMQTWSDDIAAYDPEFQKQDAVLISPDSVTPTSGSWHGSINRDMNVRMGIRETLKQDSPIWQEVDQARVLARLERPTDLGMRQMMSLYGLLAAFLHARQDLPKQVIAA